VAVFYKRWIAKSSETRTLETPIASADSVLRVNARSAEVNSRRAEKIVMQPALRHLSRYFYPDKYNQKHYSRGIRTNAGPQTKPLFAIPGAKVSHPG
jgi:hypothetical protein